MLSGAAVHQLTREVAAVAKQKPSDVEDLDAADQRALLGMAEGFARSDLDNYNMRILMEVVLHFRLTQMARRQLLLYAATVNININIFVHLQTSTPVP